MATEEQRQVMSKYQGLREEVDELHGKLAQIDGNRNEHEYV